MSAVGVLLMIAHHLFGFSDYLLPSVSWHPLAKVGGIEIERIVAAFGKICVSLFAFNSGYVAWKFRHSYSSPKPLFKRWATFLLSYWMVMAVFVLYALIIDDPIPSDKDLFMNLIGLHTGPYESYVNVAFAWYVAYYLTFLLLTPLLLRVFSGHPLTDMLVFVLIALVLRFCCKVDFLSPLMIGIEGMIAAKYNLFNKINHRLSQIPIKVLIFLEVALIITRQGYIYCHIDVLNLMGG